jgi:hypothetical protein
MFWPFIVPSLYPVIAGLDPAIPINPHRSALFVTRTAVPYLIEMAGTKPGHDDTLILTR